MLYLFPPRRTFVAEWSQRWNLCDCRKKEMMRDFMHKNHFKKPVSAHSRHYLNFLLLFAPIFLLPSARPLFFFLSAVSSPSASASASVRSSAADKYDGDSAPFRLRVTPPFGPLTLALVESAVTVWLVWR